MLVSIIIVNYNTFALTSNCVRSVIEKTHEIPYEIILVDNNSSERNPKDFLNEFPFLRLVESRVNGGFAVGNNLGISNASGDVILLLNSDTILIEDSVSIAAKSLVQQNEKMVTVRLVYENGQYQNNARKFRNIKTELLDLVRPFLFTIPYQIRSRIMLNQYFRGDFDIYCDWVSGAFMMFPRSSLALMPNSKLDERYFMYCEDQLWCYQIAPKGRGCFFLSTTSVVHIGNASTNASKQLKIIKRIIPLELDLMRLRKGKSIYYYFFKLLFIIKELTRYYIKLLAFYTFRLKIR